MKILPMWPFLNVDISDIVSIFVLVFGYLNNSDTGFFFLKSLRVPGLKQDVIESKENILWGHTIK